MISLYPVYLLKNLSDTAWSFVDIGVPVLGLSQYFDLLAM